MLDNIELILRPAEEKDVEAIAEIEKICFATPWSADAVYKEIGHYIETSDLRSNNQKNGDGDEIHFCREDLQELGRRYFDAWKTR